jgi:hypothetical protein
MAVVLDDQLVIVSTAEANCDSGGVGVVGVLY